MSRRLVFGGAAAVFALLLISPPLGLAALALCLFLGLVGWLLTPRGRPCPRCGESVETGVLDCPACGFDFRTVGAVAESAPER